MKKAAASLPHGRFVQFLVKDNTIDWKKSKVELDGVRNCGQGRVIARKLLLTFDRGMIGSRFLLLTV